MLYVLLLADALWAGRLDWYVKSQVKNMTSQVHQAMKLAALAVMENGEAQELQLEADQDWQKADAYQSKASRASYFSRADQNWAVKDRKRGAVFARATHKEQEAADNMAARAEQDHLWHVALLKNVTIDLEQEHETLQQLEAKHGGFCGIRIVRQVCDVLGGTADLQQQADQEALSLHQEWILAQKVGRQEFMEDYVAGILQGKASEYNRTATGLLKAAIEWDKRAEYDLKQAAEYNVTASNFAAAASRVEEQEKKENEWQSKNRSAAQHILMDLENEHLEIARNSALAVVVALPAIFFFSFRMFVGLSGFLTTLSPGSGPADDRQFYRKLMNCFQHVMIFLFVVGIVGNDFRNIHLHEARQSGALILRFAVLASFLQGSFLQALPHVESEWPLDREDVWQITTNFGRRLVALSALFAIEVLLAWLAMKSWLFTPGTVAFCGSALFRAASLIAMLMDIAYFGPREAVDNSDGESTVLTQDDSSIAFTSESTPLTMTNVSIETGDSPTDALMRIDLGPEGRRNYATIETESLYSSSSASPYSVSLKEELLRLETPLDALILACVAIVFRNSLAIALMDATFLVRYLALVSILFAAFVLWTIHQTRASWNPPVSMIQTTDAMKKPVYCQTVYCVSV
jgi:hypothetical protein